MKKQPLGLQYAAYVPKETIHFCRFHIYMISLISFLGMQSYHNFCELRILHIINT
uniref:Uncharacterized protein n=1 Tax=Rhizophora mucronata TaxID=61149 RepID=A0A2P2Q8C3_RHIMU